MDECLGGGCVFGFLPMPPIATVALVGVQTFIPEGDVGSGMDLR